MQPVAAAIALGYGLAALAILGYRTLRQPSLLAAFAAGAAAFPLTLVLANPIQLLAASLLGWNPDEANTTFGAGLVAVVITAAVNEVFKLAAALLVWSWGRERGAALAFGAAAGAGFAAVGAYQVVLLALAARTLPISSATGFTTSLVQQLAFVGVNAASTALAAFGMARRRTATFLVGAIAYEALFSALGLLYALRIYSSPVWTVLEVAAAGMLAATAFVLGRPRPESQDGFVPAS